MFTRARLAGAGAAAAFTGVLLALSAAAPGISADGAPGVVPTTARPGLPAGGRTAEVTVWLNAFIPNNVAGSRTVVAGPHAGSTVFPGPFPGGTCFATDQRGFSSDVAASARVHAETRFSFDSGAVRSEPPRSTETVAVSCSDGNLKCQRTAIPSGQFATVRATKSGASLDLTAAARNPCVAGAPNVDFNGRLELVKIGANVRVSFVGKVEAFPSFEMYASLNGGAPQPLFQRQFTGGLFSLFGPANVAVQGGTTFQLS